ncbi:MAG: hypothetical protein RL173_2460 [Fibrobacterota bacterium]|jgi:hypothetical protein
MISRIQKLSLVSLALGLCASAKAASVVAQPAWSRVDTGIGSLVTENGRIAQSGSTVDSGWLRILNPDGQVRWTVGMKVPSKAVLRKPLVNAMVATPDGGWIVGFDTSASRMTGSVLYRFDSLGATLGSPMTLSYDTVLSLSVVAAGTETWVAAKTHSERPTTVHHFSSSGIFLDSLTLPYRGDLLSLTAVGSRVVAHFQVAYAKSSTEHVLLLGSIAAGSTQSIRILDEDSLDCMGLTNFVKTRQGVGPGPYVLVTDSGAADYLTAKFPRVRVTSWSALGDSLQRVRDTTLDLAYAATGWFLANGDLRLLGSHQIPGGLRFEPGIVDLSMQGAATRTRTIHPSSTARVDISSVFGRGFPDGSGFACVKEADGSYAISLFDADGDSVRTVSVVPQGSITKWYAQPDGDILTLRHSQGGESTTMESWDVAVSTAIHARPASFKSLRAWGEELILDLDQPSSRARLDVVDLTGRLLSSRELGSLDAGRHVLRPQGAGNRIVRLQLDGTRLIAKMAHP